MGLQLETTSDGLHYPAGSSTFAGVFPEGFKAMMDSVGAALANAKWLRPALTGDTPPTELNKSGLYPVISSARAQDVGMPTSSMGFVEVLYGNEFYSKLTWIPMGNGTPWSRVRDSGMWGPWRPVAGARGTIPANADMDAVRGQEWAGDWDMPLAPTTNTLTGTLPTGHSAWLPGQFRVMGWAGGTTNLTSQLYMPYQSNGVWYRTIKTYVQTGALAWTPWVNLAAPAESGGSANVLLVEDFTRRRGPVNTNGKGAVALRFDHGLANFNTKIRPLLEARELPYSLALNSRSWDLAENTGVTASMVDAWVSGGLAEVWNHGAHHGDATGTEALKGVIVTGLEELRSQLPAASIDGWAVPGVGGTNYDGFNAGGAPENFHGTEGGRLILANHAVSTGYIPGTAQRKLDGTVRQGMSHYTLDAVTGTAAQYQINQAVTDATGLQLMLHPSLVDQTGNITTAKLVEILDHIVAKRDAGELVVLSPYQLTLADAYTATTAEVDKRVADALTGQTPGEGVPVGWEDITNKPSEFTPAAHNHTTAQVDGLDTKLSQLEAAIGSGGTGGTSAVTSVNGQTGAVQIDIPTVPVQSVDGQIGAVDLSTRYTSRGEQVISVTDHGAKGDDTVDDRSAIVAAVAATKAVNGVLHWPAGTYYAYQGTLATQALYSIPDFHAVRHSGPGSIRLGTTTFYPDPAQGQSNTLYVNPSGDDSNDGLHAARPFREIRAAVAALDKYGPHLRGVWTISVAAGTYKGGVRIPPWRNPSQSDFLKIVGPTVGHPGVPTAVIDKAADTSQTYGVLSDNGAFLWLEDIKVLGAFGNAVDIRQGGRIQRRNLHVEGASIGVSLNSRVSDFSRGGIIQDCTTYGVTEMFDIVRSYDSAGAAGQGTIIRNCPIGLFSKAGSQGHMDYLEVESCQIGVSIDRGSANVGKMQLRKNQVAISLKDSEIHSEGGIVWGTGAEANTRRIISYGPASGESGLWGWSSSTSPLTLRNGIRPSIQIASNYSDVTVTGTTAQTQVYNFGVILPMDRYAVQGKRLKLRAVGTLNTTLTDKLTLRMIVGGSTVGLIDLPAGTVSNTHFEFENEMICSADGNTQKNIATVRGLPAPLVKYTASTQNLTDADRSVRLDVVPYNTADSVTFRFAEVWG